MALVTKQRTKGMRIIFAFFDAFVSELMEMVFERLASAYKETLEEATGKNYNQSVSLDELEEIEDQFEIS